ncbi:MAG: gliding motility-associated C-terminal domain-containing protein, partial [Spirochaetes bacterium]|nr:gliding motility-associated C-terminal domain-containing protein [Spirochaetota bacterium]
IATNKNPGIIQLELKDNVEGDDFYYIQGINTNWQKFVIPFTNFRDNYGWSSANDINPSSIKFLGISYDDNYLQIGKSITCKTGLVFVDNIQFEVNNYAPDTINPGTPYSLMSGDKPVTSGYSFSLNNILSVIADSDGTDPTIEGVFFEYSFDGITWYLIDTDYNTTDNQYSVNWNTSDIPHKSAVKLRIYAMDASGNISDYLTHDLAYVILESELIKPDQKVVTPNGDGVNDTLLFLGLINNFEIKIFNLKGKLVRKLTDTNYWDGKDANDNMVESGPYIYQAKYKDEMISGSVIVVK